MKTCLTLSEARQWAELGSQAPLADALRLHATRCAACAEFVQAVETARELGRQLPATPLKQNRHDAVKFNVMAAARQGTGLPGRSNRHTGLGVRLLVAAFVVTATAAAGKYVVQTARKSRAPEGSNALSAAGNLSHLGPGGVVTIADARLSALTSAISGQSRSAPPSVHHDVEASPSGLLTGNPPNASNLDGDARFTEAWAALRSKRPADAAKNFDTLLNSASLDSARRADILYWSAQAHRQAGNAGAAQSRSAQLLRQYPASPFASDAALILGEYALASDRFDAAAQFLNKAATSDRQVVRERAKRALKELVDKSAR